MPIGFNLSFFCSSTSFKWGFTDIPIYTETHDDAVFFNFFSEKRETFERKKVEDGHGCAFILIND